MTQTTPLWDFHPDQPDESWEEERAELQQLRDTYRQRANHGDAEAARLLAELCQCAWDEDEAAQWWYKAAALGDEDAIEYVETYRP